VYYIMCVYVCVCVCMCVCEVGVVPLCEVCVCMCVGGGEEVETVGEGCVEEGVGMYGLDVLCVLVLSFSVLLLLLLLLLLL